MVAPPPIDPPKTVEEAIAAYPNLRWRFGVDSFGNEITARLAKLAHIALIAETGGGKSVLAASLLEMLRPYASCWIFDGKGSDHPATLVDLVSISWISKNPAEHIVGMRWLWDEMNERYVEANTRKARGQAEEAFSFPPIFVLIDELPSLRGSRVLQGRPGGQGSAVRLLRQRSAPEGSPGPHPPVPHQPVVARRRCAGMVAGEPEADHLPHGP